MSTEPIHDDKPVIEEGEQPKKSMCPEAFQLSDDWGKNFYDPNGDGKGLPTCLCKISCFNWMKILALFTIYYSFLGLFFWGMIEALFEVQTQGRPSHMHATAVY